MSYTHINGFEYITPVPPERYNDVIVHLRNNFFTDEPLNKSVKLVSPGEPHKLLEDHSLKALQDGVSIIVIEPETKELAGVALNGILKKEDLDQEIENLENVKDERFKKIFYFLYKVNKSLDLFNRYDTDRIFECRILSVDSKFRGKKIALELIKQTVELVQKKDFKVIKIDATNAFSQKISKKLGIETIYEIPYKDYKNDKGEVIFNPPEPHNSLKIMIASYNNKKKSQNDG